MRDVPFIVFEAELARLERVIHRLFILLLLTIVLLVATNLGWIWYESQFEDVTTTTTSTTHDITQDVESDGDAIVNGTGEMNIDAREADGQNKDH